LKRAAQLSAREVQAANKHAFASYHAPRPHFAAKNRRGSFRIPAGGSPASGRLDAKRLIETSEGARGPGRNVGHSRDHIPFDGQDSRALAQARPHKAQTTTWRHERHALQALRDFMNENQSAIAAMQPGDQFRGVYSLAESRPGYNSVRGAPPTEVWINEASVSLYMRPDRTLHLIHFSPKL
jgi:hypothetical protein